MRPLFSGLVKVCIVAAVFVAPALPAFARDDIRVLVVDGERSVAVAAGSRLNVNGFRKGKRIVLSASKTADLPARINCSEAFIRVNGKCYRGAIEVRKKPNGLLQVINELDIEDYLKGVVASEIPHDWEFEAVKAQAVAARTYALFQKKTAGARPYHILATVDRQVYDGKRGERPSAVRAIRETEGLVLAYHGEVIAAFYHSSCGGRTENAFEVWGFDVPYLQGVDCDCQKISKYGLWEKRIDAGRAASALAGQGYRVSGIRGIGIEGITRAGRVRQVAIEHAGGKTFIPAEKFRAAFGYSSIPSVFFEIELDGREIVVSGRGHGHGVGLCQWGAREMAQRKFDYQSILYYYYPGTEIVKRR